MRKIRDQTYVRDSERVTRGRRGSDVSAYVIEVEVNEEEEVCQEGDDDPRSDREDEDQQLRLLPVALEEKELHTSEVRHLIINERRGADVP